jgi:hypothetical protein
MATTMSFTGTSLDNFNGGQKSGGLTTCLHAWIAPNDDHRKSYLGTHLVAPKIW